MDQEHFDDLTRSVASGLRTRRQALRALSGALLSGALAGMVARLGLVEVTEAKPKHHKAKPTLKRKRQEERTSHGQLQASGKGKRKAKDKNKHHPKKRQNPPPPPPPRPPCGVGLGEYQCPNDGPCVGPNECCPGERQCPPDPDPLGDGLRACVDPQTQCCPGERQCAGGCIPAIACCVDDPYPLCGPCDEVFCVKGKYVCATKCCPNEKKCADGSCVPAGATCSCPAGGSVCNVGGVRRWNLPDGTHIDLPDGCCPTVFLQVDPASGRSFCNSAQWFGWCDL